MAVERVVGRRFLSSDLRPHPVIATDGDVPFAIFWNANFALPTHAEIVAAQTWDIAILPVGIADLLELHWAVEILALTELRHQTGFPPSGTARRQTTQVALTHLTHKAAVLWGMGRLMPLPKPERPVFIILLAQGGEFGFVVFQTAAQGKVIDTPTASLLVAAVAISMLLTPLLLVAADKWWIPMLARHKPVNIDEINQPQHAPVIIAGFGRYGQIVGRLMFANGINATVLDHDAEQVEGVRRFGWPAFYGDATRLDLMRTAGAARARVIVVAIDDVEQSLKVVDMVNEHFPHLTIVARARNVTHYYGLRERGVTLIERETLDSALMSARSVLESLGWERHQARNLALRFRRHSIGLLEEMALHQKDEAKLIAVAKQGRQQLEQLWAKERDDAQARKQRTGWSTQVDESTPRENSP